MINKFLIVALVALPFMLVACGDKAKQSEQNAEKKEKTEKAEKKEKSVAKSKVKKDRSDSEIPTIRRKWASEPLIDVAVGEPADIYRFAYAFCKEYAYYKPNKMIFDYIDDPGLYDEDETGFTIDDQPRKGYLSCSLMAECDWSTVCCYWKRDNGHRLVAFWLVEQQESDPLDDHLLAFYDYDPDTDNMMPEEELTEKVEDAMDRFDTYTVRLPADGKDIELIGHDIDEEDDSAENTYYILRWNGYDFRMEKQDD